MLTKNVLTRYTLINKCLTNPHKRYWTMRELMLKVEAAGIPVTQRTLERDLFAMRNDEDLNYRAPIVYCKRNNGFYYTDANYSIERLPLTKDDVEIFDLMLQALQRLRGTQLLQQVEGMFDKLSKVVEQLKVKGTPTPIVFFEQIPNVKGIEYFDVLHESIVKKQPLQVCYRKFADERASKQVVHPYLLKEYKFRWYLLCYSEKRRHKVILALDRIESLTPIKVHFRPHPEKDLLNYFDHTIGVTIGDGLPRDIVLWFSRRMAPYVKTQFLHSTQEIVQDDLEGLVVSLKLTLNPELTQLILSYGADVKVLKPMELKESISSVWREAAVL